MPWLKSTVNKLHNRFVTSDDHKYLKKLLTEAAERDYKRIIFKGIVVEIGEVFRVLSEIDRKGEPNG